MGRPPKYRRNGKPVSSADKPVTGWAPLRLTSTEGKYLVDFFVQNPQLSDDFDPEKYTIIENATSSKEEP